jgi:hypothetical protein
MNNIEQEGVLKMKLLSLILILLMNLESLSSFQMELSSALVILS